MSYSLWPHGLQPARFLCSWDSPGKNIGVGCHFLLKVIFLTQGSNPHLLCPALAGRFFSFFLRKRVSCSIVSDLWDSLRPHGLTHQALLSMGFPRQDYWSGLPFSSPGDLPDLGIEPKSPALQVESLPSEPPGKPNPFSRAVFSAFVTWYPLLRNKSSVFALIYPEIFRSLQQEFSRALFSKIYYKKITAGFCMPRYWILRLCLRRKQNIHILSSLT